MGTIFKNRKKYSGDRKVEQYSNDEQFTGKFWIDGKPIYKKVINFGALPNYTSKTANINAPVDWIVSCHGMAFSGTYFITIPYVAGRSNAQNRVALYATRSVIAIESGYDASGYTECYVIIEYTKTTD